MATTIDTLSQNSELERLKKKFGYKVGEAIGKGSNGKVILEKSKKGGITAVKHYKLGDVGDWEDFAARAEEEFTARMDEIMALQHDSLAKYYSWGKKDGMLKIEMELFPTSAEARCGELRSIAEKKPFQESEIKGMVRTILEGLKKLNDEGLAHEDLKGTNIFLTEDGKVKLADYSMRKQVAGVLNPSDGMSSVSGIPHFTAPEVFSGSAGEYDTMKADIWSVGGIVILLATGSPPFAEFGKTGQAMMKIMQSRSPPKYPADVSPSMKQFLDICFEREPDNRPDAEEMLQHPWLA